MEAPRSNEQWVSQEHDGFGLSWIDLKISDTRLHLKRITQWDIWLQLRYAVCCGSGGRRPPDPSPWPQILCQFSEHLRITARVFIIMAKNELMATSWHNHIDFDQIRSRNTDLSSFNFIRPDKSDSGCGSWQVVISFGRLFHKLPRGIFSRRSKV